MTKIFSDHGTCVSQHTELKLVCSVADYLTNNGYHVRLEVSNMGQSIDLVCTKNRWVTAIEAKRHNWRRALEQCKAHELVADYIIIALALKKVPINLADILQKNGWGLLMYDSMSDLWRLEIKPKKNRRVWPPQRQQFSENLRRIGYVT